MTTAYLQRIGTAVPAHDIHDAFVAYARCRLRSDRERQLFDRMAERSGIAHRYAALRPGRLDAGEVDADGFYRPGAFPGSAARMRLYAPQALDLALRAVRALEPAQPLKDTLKRVTHLVLASCTGFHAPGLDVQLVDALGLNPAVQRTVVGFMGCAAALPALRVAQHAVQADPHALALVLNVELCSLHLHECDAIEPLLMYLLFGDAASAALVGAMPHGAALLDSASLLLAASRELITWDIGDHGFVMRLSGEVPSRIEHALHAELAAAEGGAPAAAGGLLRGRRPGDWLWAVHAGGRTVLDAVQRGLGLPAHALADSRAVLHDVGNVSSATLMFVLQRQLASAAPGADGLALAFGPGLAVESLRWRMTGGT